MSLNRRGISELPHMCLAHGIDHAIISPGSRNAPLTIAFASHSAMRCFSITDERSAAYYALGMAQQLKRPVVLICTSGTAMINYAPALAEAFYLRVPLMAISADRPAEWIDQNDGQTIRQRNLYQNFVKGSFECPVETAKQEDLWYFRRTISEAFTLCQEGKPGPVHINVPLREPLYEALPEATQLPMVVKATRVKPTLSSQQWQELRKKWHSLQKKLIIAGMEDDDGEADRYLNQILANNEALVVAENLANKSIHNSIESPDRFMAYLTDGQKIALQPDLLVTLGGPIVSKRLKKYLRKYKPKEHWHIGEHEPFIDTFQSLTRTIGIKAVDFLAQMTNQGVPDDTYVGIATQLYRQSSVSHQEFFNDIPFCDLAAYEMIFRHLPKNCNLHLANSTPVRYSQLFENQQGVRYFSNRGTSGIDGCVSTAAGAAMVSDRLNIALVGDLAFIYDSNALWNNELPANLRIILIDNKGGNIFRLIETSPVINPVRHFFETPHKVKIEKLCEAFDVDYFKADLAKEIEQISAAFFKPNTRPGVLHIQTSTDKSAQIYKQYYQFISQSNEHKKKLGYA